MPYWRLFYHFVWATKYREPLISQDFEQSLHNAIAAKVIDLGGIAHAVGGIADHIHLVASVPPKIALSTFIGQVKGNSSHFVNHEIRLAHKFAWQDEYGVVSFGERHLGWVVRYVHSQAQRHEQSTTVERLEHTAGT
jgi:putative transposase